MELSTTKKFLNAVKEAGIKKYQFDTDLGTHFYHDAERSLLILDEAESTIFNFRRRFAGQTEMEYNGNIRVYAAHLSDVHEVRVGGTYEEIKKFVDSYGLNLTTEDLKVLVKIDNTNRDIMPLTGDYISSDFEEKSEEEIEKMSEEEKEKYLADLDNYKKYKGLSSKYSAQITI